ncbi:MAG: secretion protein HlyD [Holophagales bacterium]|nr:secretion protein HlyD [Holophagales bacterium]
MIHSPHPRRPGAAAPRPSPIRFLILALGLPALAAAGCAPHGDDDGALTLYGNVDIREVALAFRQAGRITAVAVEEGDEVAPGDAVATLDDIPFRQTVAAAEARLELARARLERLERGSRPQEIEQARSAVAEAEARTDAARRELKRKEGLLDSGASSERDVVAARERYETSAARLDAAREALDLSREGFRAEDVAAGRAEVRLAEAELERARTALADTRLEAPSPGIVLTRAREPGSMVSSGTPVAVLSLRDPVVVRAYVAETHLGRVPPGTTVHLSIDSSTEEYRGRVGFVSPRAEFTPKNVETPELRTDLVYRLRIVVENPDDALLQGMPVTVRVDRARGDRVASARPSNFRPTVDGRGG